MVWDGEPGTTKSSGHVPLQRFHTILLPCRGTHLPKTAKTAKTAILVQSLVRFLHPPVTALAVIHAHVWQVLRDVVAHP